MDPLLLLRCPKPHLTFWWHCPTASLLQPYKIFSYMLLHFQTQNMPQSCLTPLSSFPVREADCRLARQVMHTPTLSLIPHQAE